MRFIECREPGGPEVLRVAEGPIPEPGPGEVLIRVVAVGVNRPDVAQRKGLYPPPPGASPWLGLEVAGIVAACGSGATHFKIGDPVCALTPGGGYAEYVRTPEPHCLPIPKGLDFESAAGIPENYFTVWSNVFDRARLQPGENFLVHGGTSGIGTAAIQLATQLGAQAFATAGSEYKCVACRKLGARAAINYKTEDFVAELKNVTQGQGVHVILDMVGGSYFPKNLEALAIEGRLVQIAFLEGADVSFNLSKLMSKRLTVTGSTLRPRSIEDKGRIARELRERVWPLFENGKLKVLVDRVFPFEKLSDAHRLMESSSHIGKIIVTTGFRPG